MGVRPEGGMALSWILIVDTADEELRVGLGDDDLRWWKVVPPDGRPQHGRLLAPVVAEGMKALGITPSRLERIGAVRGPGSFTGLRIGLSFIQGLAFAQRIPVAAPLSLQVKARAFFAAGKGRPTKVLVFTPGARGKGFFALYEGPLARPLSPEILQGTLEEAQATARGEEAFFFTGPVEGKALLQALFSLTRESEDLLSSQDLLPAYGVPVIFGPR